MARRVGMPVGGGDEFEPVGQRGPSMAPATTVGAWRFGLDSTSPPRGGGVNAGVAFAVGVLVFLAGCGGAGPNGSAPLLSLSAESPASTGALSCRVLDDEARPVAGATVSLQPNLAEPQTTGPQG